MITGDKRAPNPRCNGGMKDTQIDVHVELLIRTLQHHKGCSGRLINKGCLKWA